MNDSRLNVSVDKLIYDKIDNIAVEKKCDFDYVLDLLISFYEKNKNNKIVNICHNNGVINLYLCCDNCDVTIAEILEKMQKY